MRRQVVHKTTRANCNMLKVIKFAVTSCNIICYRSFRVRLRAICGLKSASAQIAVIQNLEFKDKLSH